MPRTQNSSDQQDQATLASQNQPVNTTGGLAQQGEMSAEWDTVLKNTSTVERQAELLSNPRFTRVQRQAIASRLGRISGNRHLQRVMAQVKATSGPGTDQSVVQRDDTDNSSGADNSSGSAPPQQDSANPDSSNGEEPDVLPPEAEGGTGTTTSYLAKDKALKVLQDSFGSYKQMVEGTVKLLAQAEFQAAYDNIYGTTQYSWATYVVPKFGNLGGFAYGGTNYINTNIASSTTVPHEMLHNNADASWSGFVGSNIDEGTTEYLTFVALTAAKYTGMTSKYPNQYGVIKDLVTVMGDEPLKKAYFKGANEELRRAFNQKCKGAWVDFKARMDEGKWTQAKALTVANT